MTAPDLEGLLERALGLGEEGRWREMAELLAGALEDEPDDPYLLGWLGVAERELDNDGAAYEYFRRCLKQEPVDPHLLALAGSGLALFDDPEAETALRAAALSGPEVPMARLQYGSYLARIGMFDEALQHLEAARELAPEDPTVHSETACALALSDDLDAAVDAMEEALARAPDDSWNRTLLGLLYVETGEIERAAETLHAAAEARDDDTEVQFLAALASSAMGWQDAAHEALARGEMTAEGVEAETAREVESRILAGGERSRAMLVDALGPSVLRERLLEPL